MADDHERDVRAVELVATLVPEGRVIACYLSRDYEPGTLDLADHLVKRYRLLVPKIGIRADGTPRRVPDWTWFSSRRELTEGPFGIPEPAGPGLGADALGRAELVIASALGAGPDGSRIGTGGGWFDRALLHRRPGTPVLVLLNEDEVQAQPQLPHDQTVDWLVTPTRTIRTSITD